MTRLKKVLLPALVIIALIIGCSRSDQQQSEDKSHAGKTFAANTLPGTLRLKGAGATFPALLYEKWFALYMNSHPDIVLQYEPVGSGTGIERFIGKGVDDDRRVDFGASDAAMTDAEIAKVERGVKMIPMTAGGVVLAYNISGLQGELKLSREAYAGIFLGKIKDWNDPVIRDCNPGLQLPKMTITVVVRSDGSGTTFAFTKHLDAISNEWRQKYGPATFINWPGRAMRAKGNDGVAGAVRQSLGSIGYMELGYARKLGLPVAAIQNKAGKYIKPSVETALQSMSSCVLPENLRLFFPDPEGPDSYPIVTLTWVLLYDRYDDPKKAEALRNLFDWCLHAGQAYSEETGYLPLPEGIVDCSTAALKRVSR